MCWKSEKKPILYEAKKDIPICKVCLIGVNKDIYSYYYRQLYKLNKRYQMDKSLNVQLYEFFNDARNNFYYVNEGFHSYEKNCCIKRTFEGCVIKNKYDDTLDYHIRGNIALVSGCIPKGAKYFINNRDEYVSDAICLTNIDCIYVLDEC